jgi:hypothetical protein
MQKNESSKPNSYGQNCKTAKDAIQGWLEVVNNRDAIATSDLIVEIADRYSRNIEQTKDFGERIYSADG